jgi:ribonuclease PH
VSDVVEGTATDLPVAKPAGPEYEDAPQDVVTPEEEAAPLNLVIVVVEHDGETTQVSNVSTQGDVRATEVQTLLELAVPAWRQKVGLSK